MRIKQMSGDKLILHDQLNREVAVLGVQRVFAVALETVGEQDVDKVGNPRSMTETGSAAVKPVHVHVIGQRGKAQMTVAQRRQQPRIVGKPAKPINQFESSRCSAIN